MALHIKVTKVQAPAELKQVYMVRRKVFVEEQHCPPELEYANEEESHHFVALCDGIPCGAARWRQTEKGIKLERFAVLPEYRGMGVGAQLMTAVLNDIPQNDLPVYLNAQLPAEKFYAAFGFKPVGDHFEEAGIMHQQMIFASRS